MPAAVAVTGGTYAGVAITIAGAYAFGIIAFLTGAWWGMALAPGNARAMWLGNLYFLVALFAYLFAPARWPLAAALLLVAIYLAEQHSSMLPGFSASYRRVRVTLTAVAAASMLAIHFTA